MARSKQALSAKDFRIPLFRVLGDLTRMTPGMEVRHEDVYSPVFTIMGIGRDDYGFETTSKTPYTERWTQWAFREMRDKGEGEVRGRGNWSLTAKGVLEAKAVAEALINATPLPVPDPEDVAASEPDLVTLAETPILSAGHSISVPKFSDDLYHPDPYIRQLALDNHICFGFFTQQSPICSSCPARNLCVRALATKFSTLAAQLNQEDEKGTVVPAAKVEAKAPVVKAGKIPSSAKVTFSLCQVPGVVCAGCQQNIAQQDPSAWVRHTDSGAPSSAMYHRACYDAAKE